MEFVISFTIIVFIIIAIKSDRLALRMQDSQKNNR